MLACAGGLSGKLRGRETISWSMRKVYGIYPWKPPQKEVRILRSSVDHPFLEPGTAIGDGKIRSWKKEKEQKRYSQVNGKARRLFLGVYIFLVSILSDIPDFLSLYRLHSSLKK